MTETTNPSVKRSLPDVLKYLGAIVVLFVIQAIAASVIPDLSVLRWIQLAASVCILVTLILLYRPVRGLVLGFISENISDQKILADIGPHTSVATGSLVVMVIAVLAYQQWGTISTVFPVPPSLDKLAKIVYLVIAVASLVLLAAKLIKIVSILTSKLSDTSST